MLYLAKDSKTIKMIFSVIFSTITFLVDFIPMILSINKGKENIKENIKLKILSFCLFIIIVIIAIIGNTIATNSLPNNGVNNPPVGINTDNESDMVQSRKIYNFNTVTKDNDFDVYFNDSSNEDILYENILYSLQNIAYRLEPTKKQLEGNNPYGNNALVAAHYEELLKNELTNKNAKSTDVTKLICETALKYSKEMDNEYDTSDSRNRIVRITQISYRNKLNDDNGEMHKECIRYAWGVLFTEISYDRYNEKTIDTLIEIYQETNEKRSIIIISALKRIKSFFSSNPPHPVKNIK